ncbi:gephyrin-like molybdotransferase receptor GlpR [Kitasatospora sp. GAS1066B]|uniref:divisome protein SepX/GlpR n=1 Tax=Kitasatospora sp. GAS1066B TaxID=3156271 RepID=UPI003518F4F5
MSSSGLIYAVIVGAWAAYLVPMWLRRQDELNEARPTERFSTAIRLLAGRSAMERRASRALGDNDPTTTSDGTPDAESADAPSADPPSSGAVPSGAPSAAPSTVPAGPSSPVADPAGDRRARVLARRRRMVTVLFLAFALGAIVAAVAGVGFLWAPGLPALLLTLYIGHLRRLERQRYEVKLDRVRAAQAAQRVREREQARSAPTLATATAPIVIEPEREHPQPRFAAAQPEPPAARQALVEATDHQEWVDGLRERAAAGPDSWEPVPVPLPTYVTAPVAPRVTRGLDLAAPGTWTSGRPAESTHTPLFDQYETPPAARPRAAGE